MPNQMTTSTQDRFSLMACPLSFYFIIRSRGHGWGGHGLAKPSHSYIKAKNTFYCHFALEAPGGITSPIPAHPCQDKEQQAMVHSLHEFDGDALRWLEGVCP